jgi:hypothetical protein
MKQFLYLPVRTRHQPPRLRNVQIQRREIEAERVREHASGLGSGEGVVPELNDLAVEKDQQR